MKVVVAVITDAENRVLITQRPHHVSHGGCWEFPGGKLESNESPEEALSRELKEELGIEVQSYQDLGVVNHVYPEHSVELLIFKVTHFMGMPQCLEGQQGIKWVARDLLNPEDFPEANREIFGLI